jgi:hypothetical protein
MKIFSVESGNKYYISIKEIENIEDAGDDFITDDEIREMLGEKACGTYGYDMLGVEDREIYGMMYLFEDRIRDELALLKAELVKSGKKTIVSKDAELVEILQHRCCASVGQFVEGMRRNGNRFSFVDKTQKQPKKADLTVLIGQACRTISKRVGVDFIIRRAHDNRSASVELLKKMISWEEIDWKTWYGYQIEEDKIGFMKMIWDNPKIFDEATC